MFEFFQVFLPRNWWENGPSFKIFAKIFNEENCSMLPLWPGPQLPENIRVGAKASSTEQAGHKEYAI